ncbi:tetratricopeptide repeat protein [Leadbettera azotonutricia]|uniref:Tetratricopeptide repeat protein n=1 Tax=Leadbettera azotonutricia (strain ATCC BAA-888 / DSM 13862 / ZAS-9) TaxID=545695 RepID=F5YCE9_LEAAZ|nr:tetratricopeptide repeat protein [Leadbettera azotonutricia]AEF81030.1 tetratricopeptide repeat protein [Leadbettera azotonutricia ZAS-9]
MDSLIPILAAVVVLVIGIFLVMIIMGRSKSGGGNGKGSKGRDAIIKNTTKRLSQNPHDPEALSELGALYFKEEDWNQAYKTYGTLTELGSAQGEKEFENNYRFGLSALKLGMTDDAYKGFSAARGLNQNNFDVNYNLGVLEFQKKNYEKAIQVLNQARLQDPEHAPTLRTLGHSFFRLKKNKEAMTFIRKAIDLAPDDKESLYTLAECYYEANQTEQAQRIFSHLRGDPVMGASACLISGTINAQARQYDKAIQDFELGLRHENIKADVRIELRYQAATTLIKQNEIGKALGYLKDIQLENPNYKDVSPLIGRYQELNANKNLQIFLMAPSGDFVALCRKIVMSYYQKAKVKVTNISVNKNEWADVLAEVDTAKWEDLIMFRFIRTPGSIGELIVRDFHSHLKEVKAGKGICITVGNFTEEAKRYTEARLIDLIEKDRLTVILNTVDAKVAAAAPKTPAKK